MKILIVVPNISQSGGTERAATNLANMLEITGYTIVLLSLSSFQNDHPYYSLNSAVNVIHLGLPATPAGIVKKFKWYPRTISVLRKKTAEIMPDIIFGEGHNVNSMLPFIKISHKAPIIGCEHIVFSSIPLSSRLIMKLVYFYLDGLVVLSTRAKTNMEGLNKNITVIPNTLPFVTVEVSPLNSGKLLMVGRLSAEKGYARLVPIARMLKKRYPLWHIDIFGEGDLREELLKLYSQENLDDYITINTPKKNIQDEYLKSSVYLMTSYSEAMPMVLLEAKSFGVPVIGYKCEGTSELINHQEDGFLIDDGDVKSFIEKVSILIDDKELRRRMGIQARKNALLYAPESIIHTWKILINQLVNK